MVSPNTTNRRKKSHEAINYVEQKKHVVLLCINKHNLAVSLFLLTSLCLSVS